MIHSGEERTNGIRCRFNPSIGINFQGAKISSDTGILLLREIDERFGITSALEGMLQDSRNVSHTQHSCTDLLRQRVYQNTVVRTFFVNVSIKSQQAMKTAMTPMSFARIRPFVSLWTKTTLMRQASHSCQDLKTKSWVTCRDFMLWTVCSNGASIPS